MRAFRRIAVILRHHQLLAAFVRKDFDVRYSGSVFGVLWTQLYPLLLLGVYTVVFSVIFENSIPRFPLFLFVGIALWNFFSSSIMMATGSVLANGNLISKVAFPREVVTISVVLMALIDLGMSHFILVLGALLFGVGLAWSWLALPLIVALMATLCTGLGLALAAAAVYMRDVRFFVDVGVLLLMFLSAVFYSASSVPSSVSWMVDLNPLAAAISAYRDAFLDGVWPSAQEWLMLGVPAIVALWLGIEVFDRSQRGFPDAL